MWWCKKSLLESLISNQVISIPVPYINKTSVYLSNSVQFLIPSTLLFYFSWANVSCMGHSLIYFWKAWVRVCYFIGSLFVNTKILAAKSQTSRSSFSLKSRSHATDWRKDFVKYIQINLFSGKKTIYFWKDF